jgi:2-polyprenyl-6-hydroxyphenyl methylase/3-demethylubiquinone-9 3-methyltransferase
MEVSKHSDEVNDGKRFEFGANWDNFLRQVDEKRIMTAVQSLQEFFGKDNFNGLRFIDVGCGSGLFSLAAKRLGATVYSFDYDPLSVVCANQLKSKYFENDPEWVVMEGSALDNDFIGSLGEFDLVYSWGVLHHTGNMWKAIENVMPLTKMNGLFFIAIYNKQGWKSKFWWGIKLVYNKLPKWAKDKYALTLGFAFEFLNIVKYTLLLKPKVALKPLLEYRKNRGMSIKYDIIDWMGGFPYEYATVQELNTFFDQHSFTSVKEVKTQSQGCNQIVYKKEIKN